MKKGFTIIELIAVVTIIAVLIAVAFLMLSGSINSAKVKAYNQNIDKVVETTELYIANGNLDSPLAVGDTAEVTVEELITAGYMKTMKSPFNKSNTCNGYVLVEKTIENDYLYSPYLNCAADIGNSTEDKLILHYTFDDFQEPTTNVVPNSTIFNNGWSPYGSGNDGTFVTEFGTEGLNIVNRISWTGAYKSITLPSPGTYTLSVWVKVISRTHTNINCNLYTSGGGIGDTSVSASWSPDKIGQWQKIEMTRTYLTNSIYLYLISYGGAQAEQYRVSVQYTMPQIEKKAYSTPFVNGSRTGVVKDYSGNNNVSNLSLDTTPRWIEDGYSFDGINDFVNLGNSIDFNMTDKITLVAWIYCRQQDSNYNGIVSKTLNNSNGWEFRTVGYNSSETEVQFRLNGDLGAPIKVELNNNKWYFLVGTFDGAVSKFYVNGQLAFEKAYSSPILINSNDLKLGVLSYVSSLNFNGIIDDVRIYNRALSENEIRNIYYLTK